MATVVETFTESERLEGASLLAPSVEAVIDRTMGSISYCYSNADPEHIEILRQGVANYRHLGATKCSFHLPWINASSGDGTLEMRLTTEVAAQAQQLSTLSPYRLQSSVLVITCSILKFIAELEDRGYYLPLFKLSSFICLSGNLDRLYLLDVSLLTRDPSNLRSSHISLANLVAQLCLAGSEVSPERVVNTLLGKRGVGGGSSQVNLLPLGAKRFIKQILSSNTTSQQQCSLLKISTDFLKNAKRSRFRASWQKRSRVSLLIENLQHPPKWLLRIPTWVLLFSLSTVSVGTCYGAAALGGYLKDVSIQEELADSLPSGVAVLFDNKAKQTATLAAAANDMNYYNQEEEEEEGQEDERSRQAELDYKQAEQNYNLRMSKDCQNCDLSDRSFDSKDNFNGVNLTGADLSNTTFDGTNLSGAIFDGATVVGTTFRDIHFVESSFDNVVFKNTTFLRSSWDGVSARHSDIRGINKAAPADAYDTYGLAMSGVDFSHSILDEQSWISSSGSSDTATPEAKSKFRTHRFHKASMRGFKFSGGSLQNVDFRGADLTGAILRSTDLSGANLSGADLSGADLFRANLTETKAVGATFKGATLSGAIAAGTNFSEADFSKARLRNLHDESTAIIEGATFTDVVTDGGTRFSQPMQQKADE